MRGTKKQVDWAWDIRAGLISKANDYIKAGDTSAPWVDIRRAIKKCDSARVFIDRRYLPLAEWAQFTTTASDTVHRVPLNEYKEMGTGPYAGCELQLDEAHVVERTDTYVDYRGERLQLREHNLDPWTWVSTEEALRDEPRRLLPPPTPSEDWAVFYVPRAEVEVGAGHKADRITLTNSEKGEGLWFYVNEKLVTRTRIRGMYRVALCSWESYRLYGGATRKLWSGLTVYKDRTNRLDAPGPSQVVTWQTLTVHQSRQVKLRNRRAIIVDIPENHPTYPGWAFFHPTKLCDGHKLRTHDRWEWRLLPPRDSDAEPVTLSTEDMRELLADWAPEAISTTTTTGNVRTTEPVHLPELQRVEVLDDLADDLTIAA
ncbi:hypothetical protein [uncultured Tessaracoccus sp.]|uniref:hypothetical protein n=1 Tax=uncultured Tessaracoccus sp. TaxID=905023 RepID=UPI0026351B34|nr:hypothetical protein [uncultured Tessaracoccus sp.]